MSNPSIPPGMKSNPIFRRRTVDPNAFNKGPNPSPNRASKAFGPTQSLDRSGEIPTSPEATIATSQLAGEKVVETYGSPSPINSGTSSIVSSGTNTSTVERDKKHHHHAFPSKGKLIPKFLGSSTNPSTSAGALSASVVSEVSLLPNGPDVNQPSSAPPMVMPTNSPASSHGVSKLFGQLTDSVPPGGNISGMDAVTEWVQGGIMRAKIEKQSARFAWVGISSDMKYLLWYPATRSEIQEAESRYDPSGATPSMQSPRLSSSSNAFVGSPVSVFGSGAILLSDIAKLKHVDQAILLELPAAFTYSKTPSLQSSSSLTSNVIEIICPSREQSYSLAVAIYTCCMHLCVKSSKSTALVISSKYKRNLSSRGPNYRLANDTICGEQVSSRELIPGIYGLDVLGEGAAGKVYISFMEKLEIFAAVKVISKNMLKKQKARSNIAALRGLRTTAASTASADVHATGSAGASGPNTNLNIPVNNNDNQNPNPAVSLASSTKGVVPNTGLSLGLPSPNMYASLPNAPDIGSPSVSSPSVDMASGVESIYEEAEVLRILNHKNIIKFIDIKEDSKGKTVFLIVEFVPRGRVMSSTTMRGATPIQEDQAGNIFVQVLAGLDYMHSRNVIHRDIKPDNLLIAADGTIKISDFGTALFVGDERDTSSQTLLKSRNVQHHLMVGTPVFMPPEACVHEFAPPAPSKPFASDIWALGITLYFMLYGQAPFISNNLFEIQNLICTADPVFPDEKTKVTFANRVFVSTDAAFGGVSTVLEESLKSGAGQPTSSVVAAGDSVQIPSASAAFAEFQDRDSPTSGSINYERNTSGGNTTSMRSRRSRSSSREGSNSRGSNRLRSPFSDLRDIKIADVDPMTKLSSSNSGPSMFRVRSADQVDQATAEKVASLSSSAKAGSSSPPRNNGRTVSAAAKSLIRSLLNKNPLQRPRTKDIMKDPWVMQYLTQPK